MGFTTTWGATDGFDVEIMGLIPFKERMVEFAQLEADAYALDNPVSEV
jgi:hypothetical protein